MIRLLNITIIFLIGMGMVSGQKLASTNLQSNVLRSNWRIFWNPIGLSMELEQVLPQLNNTLFQNYHKNSFFYGDWNTIFQQTLHVSPGTRYKCAQVAQLTSSNIGNCKIQLNNETLLATLGQYIWNYTNYYSFIIGWDMKDTNFLNTNYIINVFTDFVLALYKKARQPFVVELVDQGDLYGELGLNPNYTATQFVKDCKSVNSNLYGAVLMGPGATQNASKYWYTQNQEIYWYCGFFSYRAYVFEDQADMNISNLLSETYTTAFWQRRFIFEDVDVLNDFDSYLGVVNDFKITKDPMGRDGFTNTFAAAVFTIQCAIEYFYMGGFYLSFYNPIKNQSFQSPYGQLPNFAPNSLYYSLLLLALSTRRYPYIQKPVVTSGASTSIKVYGFRYYGTQYGFIIINKDEAENASGYVEVSIRDNSGVNCIYLSADNLNSTDGITLGGVSFISGNATYQGNFTPYKYYVNAYNNYEIQLNYSQIAFCKTDTIIRMYPFPRGQSSFEVYHYLASILLLLVAFVA